VRHRDEDAAAARVTNIDEVAARLRVAGCVFAEARLLLGAATGDADLEARIARRESGEPLEYVVGWAEFCGLRIEVDPGVFIPRPRTEALAEAAVEAARAAGPDAIAVDLCCGAGAIAAALRERLDIEVHAAELDAAAVRCARRNLEPRGVNVHEGDLFAALPAELAGRVDVLVANVPYVPTAEIALLRREARDFEPALALDGGSDGLDVLRRVVDGAPAWLAPCGVLLVETSVNQSNIADQVLRAGSLEARVEVDDELDVAVVSGRHGTR
jgi:release factor glutamine methyltransferase